MPADKFFCAASIAAATALLLWELLEAVDDEDGCLGAGGTGGGAVGTAAAPPATAPATANSGGEIAGVSFPAAAADLAAAAFLLGLRPGPQPKNPRNRSARVAGWRAGAGGEITATVRAAGAVEEGSVAMCRAGAGEVLAEEDTADFAAAVEAAETAGAPSPPRAAKQ